jgi:hypothetical protein
VPAPILALCDRALVIQTDRTTLLNPVGSKFTLHSSILRASDHNSRNQLSYNVLRSHDFNRVPICVQDSDKQKRQIDTVGDIIRVVVLDMRNAAESDLRHFRLRVALGWTCY